MNAVLATYDEELVGAGSEWGTPWRAEDACLEKRGGAWWVGLKRFLGDELKDRPSA